MPYSKQNPYTGDQTKVLMSFSMAGMGSIFCSWLRRQIMLDRGYASLNSVYIDNVAMRYLESTTVTVDNRFNTPSPNTLIGAIHQANPELRQVAVDKGKLDPFVGYSGAMNPIWNEAYQQAMSEAHTMIFSITDGWLNSLPCFKEWSQFNAEIARRPGTRSLKGVALIFPGSYKQESTGAGLTSSMALNAANVEVLAVTKVPGAQAYDGFELAHTGAWGISETDLKRVLAAIAPD